MLKYTEQVQQIIAVCRSDAEASPDQQQILQNKLFDMIGQMPDEAKTEMLALMWTGGPKNENSYEENLKLADKTKDENHAEVLSAQGSNLATLLTAGLQRTTAGQP